MAFPIVLSITPSSFNVNATAHQVAMPATVDVGDLLLVLFSNDGGDAVTTPGGWTALFSGVPTGQTTTVRFGGYAKVAVGNEGGTTVNFVTSGTEMAAAQVYRIEAGTWGGTLEDIEAATPSDCGTVDSNAPNPPSLEASWGAKDNLWIACCGIDDDDGCSAYPTNYTDGTYTKSGTATGSCSLASARRGLNNATDDPSAFTLPAAEEWVANTIVVRPYEARAGILVLTGSLAVVKKSTKALAGVLAATGSLAAGFGDASRLYVAASSEGHYVDATPVSAMPLTISGWFKFADVTNSHGICMVVNKGALGDYYWLFVWGDKVYAEHRRGTAKDAITTTSPSDNTWHHGAAVFVSTTERSVFLDGGGKGTNTDSLTAAQNLDRIAVGYAGDVTPTDYANGNIFEVAIWNIELSDAEIAQLADGADPTTIQADNLVALYFTGPETDNDQKGSYHLTAIGTPEWDADDIPPLRAGGTVYYQSADGAFAPTGVLVKNTKTAKAGNFTLTGIITKKGFVPKAGAVTFSGAATRFPKKPLAGVVTFAGSVTKAISVSLAGVLTATGALATSLVGAIQQAVGGVLTFSGAVVNKAAKALGGTLTMNGAIVKKTMASLAGVFVLTGTVGRAIKKTLSGVLTLTGTIKKKIARALAGIVTFTGEGRGPGGNLFYQAVGGVLTFVGALGRFREVFRIFGRLTRALAIRTGGIATSIKVRGAMTQSITLRGRLRR